eukprot:4512518-Pyramimonas_sp.AAC.1
MSNIAFSVDRFRAWNDTSMAWEWHGVTTLRGLLYLLFTVATIAPSGALILAPTSTTWMVPGSFCSTRSYDNPLGSSDRLDVLEANFTGLAMSGCMATKSAIDHIT